MDLTEESARLTPKLPKLKFGFGLAAFIFLIEPVPRELHATSGLDAAALNLEN
jgi:hypothetical protein